MSGLGTGVPNGIRFLFYHFGPFYSLAEQLFPLTGSVLNEMFLFIGTWNSLFLTISSYLCKMVPI